MKTIKHLFLALVVAIVATSLAAPGNPPVTASSAKPTVSTELEHLGLGPSLPLTKLVLGAADTPPKLGGSTDEGRAAAEETVGAVLAFNDHQQHRSGGASFGATGVATVLVT